MGVRITAYSRLQLTEPHEHVEDCYDVGHVHAFAYAEHRRSYDGLAEDGQLRFGSPGQFIGGRCYAPTAATVENEVVAVSYTSYGRWREHLAQAVVGVTPEEVWANPSPECPFVDLIHFADNEGSIGPKAAARLLADFTDPGYAEKFKEATEQLDSMRRIWWKRTWDGFVEGVRLAADNGLIRYS